MPIKQSGFDEGTKPDEPKPDAPKDETAKPRRRNKAQLIADAVIPADDDVVQLKFMSTGTKGERKWLEAVELFRDKKVEFVDPPDAPSPLKYAVEKMDQEKGGAPPAEKKDLDDSSVEGLTLRWLNLQAALDEMGTDEGREQLDEEAEMVRKQIVEIGGQDPASDEAYAARAGDDPDKKVDDLPAEAQLGDEIRIGADVFRLGHGNTLTSGPVEKDGAAAKPRHQWQRELGTGGKGPWQIVETYPVEGDDDKPEGDTSKGAFADPAPGETTGPVQVANSVEHVNGNIYRVTMGYLEKIGLPDYSALHIGPATVTHEVADDGRRIKVTMGDREVELPAAVVEAQKESAHICEYVMRSERSALIHFLEAVKPGSTQPK